ncbi:MBL fold metallo-hydrolase [Angustibacter peucedani]
MSDAVVEVPMQHEIPAGALGPDPVVIDVRAFLVPGPTGLVLVDTGMDASGSALDAALAAAGAAWSDVTDVVVSHHHPDHTGALDHVRRQAPRATVHAHPLDEVPGTSPLLDGERVGSLRAFATPGHTPGHLSLVDDDRGVLLASDCLGVVDGQLRRGPEMFTADPEEAERSLHRLLELRGARVLLSHGPELEDPWGALDRLLER